MFKKLALLMLLFSISPIIFSMEQKENDLTPTNNSNSAVADFNREQKAKGEETIKGGKDSKKGKEKISKAESSEKEGNVQELPEDYTQFYDIPSNSFTSIPEDYTPDFNDIGPSNSSADSNNIQTIAKLLAINAQLTNSLTHIASNFSISNTNENKLSKEDLLALSFKQDNNSTTNGLVGDKPERIQKIVQRLKNPDFYRDYSIKQHLLLIGEAGTGKSSIAKLIAQETERDFYKVPASALITSYQGSGAQAIRSLFTYIKKQGIRSVIFIDEIDGVADSTAKDNTLESIRTVYELHDHLDNNHDLIICVLATNHIEKLPIPLKTRFFTVKIELPAYKKRLEILKYYAKNRAHENLLRKIASETTGLSCRDLEKLSKEAFLMALDEEYERRSNQSIQTISNEISTTSIENSQQNSIGTLVEMNQISSAQNRPTIELQELHYLVATYVTQTSKLPNEQMRRLLFNYYNGRHAQLSEDMLELAIKETQEFTAHDIEEALQNAYELAFEHNNSTLRELDLLAGIYYKQKKKFADSSNRAKLFRYFRDQHPHDIAENTCNILADHTMDQFTGEEIQNVVKRAHDLANAKGPSRMEDIDIYVALHEAMRKKGKPYKAIYSKNRVSNKNLGCSVALPSTPLNLNAGLSLSTMEKTEEILPLAEKDDLEGESIKGDSNTKITRKDYRTKVNPNFVVRTYLIMHFISQIPQTFTIEQIKELVLKTENFSWYSIEQFIQDAKDQSSDNNWRLNGNSFLKVCPKYNISLSNIFIQSNMRPNNNLIQELYNQMSHNQTNQAPQIQQANTNTQTVVQQNNAIPASQPIVDESVRQEESAEDRASGISDSTANGNPSNDLQVNQQNTITPVYQPIVNENAREQESGEDMRKHIEEGWARWINRSPSNRLRVNQQNNIRPASQPPVNVNDNVREEGGTEGRTRGISEIVTNGNPSNRLEVNRQNNTIPSLQPVVNENARKEESAEDRRQLLRESWFNHKQSIKNSQPQSIINKTAQQNNCCSLF